MKRRIIRSICCLGAVCALFAALACAEGDPPATATLEPTATAVPTLTPEPTPTPTVRPTRTPIPTPTPLPPVDINSDCVGCPVVMPYQISQTQQSVMKAYSEWPGSGKHPDKVLLVTCYKGERSPDLGHVMGPPLSYTKGNVVLVSGRFWTSSDGSCYAITAKYDGLKEVCWETIPFGCQFGGGRTVSVLGFKGVGEFTEVSTSKLRILMSYARATEYRVAD